MKSVQTCAVLCLLLSTASSAFAGEMYGVVLQRPLFEDEAVRCELNLNAEQTEFLDQMLTDLADQSSNARAQIEALTKDSSEEDIRKWLDASLAVNVPLSDKFEQQLISRLRPGQVKRLCELCVQYRSDMMLCGFLVTNAQVQAALKISEDQRVRLKSQLVREIRERGAPSGRVWKHKARDILTAKQREKLTQLRGNPFLPRRYMTEQGKDREPIVLPIRVHLLTSDAVAELQCSFTDDEIQEHFIGVNAIWSQAGIVWKVESITREPVASSDGYRELLASAAKRDRSARSGQNRQKVLLGLIPDENRLDPGFNVYIVEDLGLLMGGVFMPRHQFVLSGRSGPKGEQRPTVLAHELGHALSLPHVDGNTPGNLMATGGKFRVQMLSTYLNDEQIEAARRQARTGRPLSASVQLAKRIDGLFKKNDANDDGQISRAEALRVVKSNFQAFDANDDGVVDRLEFDENAAKFIQRTTNTPGRDADGDRNPGNAAILDARFQANDDDGDGRISPNEARPFVKSKFKEFDADGNGQIDRKEFGIAAPKYLRRPGR